MPTDSREQLQARKRDLFASLHALERDREEGDIDGEAYRVARRRYELEAADVLERLDSLPVDGVTTSPAANSGRPTGGRARLVAGAAGTFVAVAIIIFLVTALRARGAGQSITGVQPGNVNAPVADPTLVAATAVVRRHPRSVDALLALGQAYLKSNARAADREFLAAGKLAPDRPEPPTLHALVLASLHRYDAALTILTGVEHRHPRYARAWLEDGLVASRRRPGFPRAIVAWKRFLALDGHSAVAGEVRGLLASLIRAEGGTR